MKNILHIWDIGGSSSVSMKAMRSIGYDGDVVMRSLHDPFGFTAYYNEISLDIEGNPYLNLCRKMARNYDIIHVHGIHSLVPKLRSLYPNKTIVLQYHGSDLIDCPNDGVRMFNERDADAILYSTIDMASHLGYMTEIPVYYMPNAIDTDLYKHIDNPDRMDKAVMFSIRYLDVPAIIEHCETHCPWEYVIHDREKDHVPSHLIPQFYSNYSGFIDLKIMSRAKANGLGMAMSNSGLQALACGLDVFNYNNEIVRGLPAEHTMEHHAKKMDEIYQKAISKRCAE